MSDLALPFPYASLPRWRRRDVALVRALVRGLGAPSQPRPQRDGGLRALLGAPLVAQPHAPALTDRGTLLRSLDRATLAAVLSLRHGCAVVACDRPFALSLAQRCLGGPDAPEVTYAPHGPLAPRWEGALTALTARLLARAFDPAPPPVVRAITDDLPDAIAALHGDPLLAWPWTLALGERSARVTVVLERDARPAFDSPSWRRLDDLPVVASAVAGRARWTLSALASLARGEVIALDGLSLCEGTLRGDVSVAMGHPPGLARAARLRDDGAVVLCGALVPFMEDHDDEAQLATLPVEVAVEIARESFSFAEVAAWRAGEVVPFRARVGDVVTVRASGRAIARGELVDIEGDVGVRIVEIL